MTNQDKIIAYIRTAVPALVGSLIAWLVSQIPAVGAWLLWVDQQLAVLGGIGVTVNGLLVAAGTAGAIAGYYALARWLGAKYPFLEKWLLGRSAVPVYVPSTSEVKAIAEVAPDPEKREVNPTAGEAVIITEDPAADKA